MFTISTETIKPWYKHWILLMTLCLIGLVGVCKIGYDYLTRFEPTNPHFLLDRAKAAASHIAERQLPNGFFEYEVDLADATVTNDTNVVRQTGAAYGLSTYIASFRDLEVETALKKALQAYQRASLPHHDGALISLTSSLKQAQSGATALALLAELYYSNITNDTSFQKIRLLWLKGLMALSLPNAGFQTSPSNPQESPYFNGEIWLALSVYNALFPQDQQVTDLLIKIDDYMMQRYSSGFDVGFFHWGMMATAQRYAITQDKKFLKFGAFQINLFFKKFVPKSSPYANSCYGLEGLIPIAEMFQESGTNQDLQEQIYEYVQKKIKHNLDLQIMPGENEQITPLTLLLKGAFRNSALTTKTRIDSTQHCLSATVKTAGYFTEHQGTFQDQFDRLKTFILTN
jgi:hypothetical protein